MNYNDNCTVSLFFDTNILEARHSGNKLHLSDIKTNSIFYRISKFIQDNELNIELCIPEIVYLEIKNHLLNFFKSEYDSIHSSLELYKKSFGSILDVKCEFTKNNKNDYHEHFNFIWDAFLTKYNCRVIDYPRGPETMDSIIYKAIKSQKPFVFIEKGGKDKKGYSDAGFKDAVICETILQYHIKTNKKCIVITSDHDFCNVFEKGLDILSCKDFESLRTLLSEYFNITDADLIKQEIEGNEYIQEKLLEAIGNKLDDAVTKFSIENSSLIIDDMYDLEIECIINEVVYKIECIYEASTKEFVKVNYKTSND